MAHYLQVLRVVNGNVRLYLISAALFGFTYFGGIFSVLLNLYVLRLGYGPEFVGLVNATGLLAMAAGCVPAGILGGRWGSRRIMIAGLGLMAVGSMAFTLAELIPSSLQAGWLLTTNLLSGFGLALYFANTTPCLMSITSPVERNYVYAVQAALWPLAGFIGSLVSSLAPGYFAQVLATTLESPLPYRYPLLLAALLLIPAALALYAAHDGNTRRMPAKSSVTEIAPYGMMALLILVGLLQKTGEGAARTFFNIYLDSGLRLPVPQIGVLTAVGQLVAVPAALAMPLWAARWDGGRIFVVGSMGMALSLVLLGLVPNWSGAGLGFLGMIALASITRPAMSVYQMEIVAPGWQAAMSGATTLATALSWSATALGGSYMITVLGYRSLFLTAAALTAGGALLFWAYLYIPRWAIARYFVLAQAVSPSSHH